MKMKKIILSSLLLALCISADAQRRNDFGDSDIPKSVAKINVFSIAQSTISLQYEYILGAKTSVAMGVRFSPNKKAPGQLFTDPTTGAPEAGGITDVKFGGYAFTPEFRYYLSKQAGKGFYIGPFARYEKFTMSSNIFLQDNNTTNTAQFKGSLGGIGAGVLFGSQFSLGEKFSLDWWIFGPYFKSHKLAFKATSADFGLSVTELSDLNAELNSIENTVLNGFSGTATNQEISLSAKTKLPGIRTGLCLGYRF